MSEASIVQWIEEASVVEIQRELIARHGGLHGLRDKALLESALARPRNLIAYGAPDIYELAASYAVGLCKNHAFIDGNKRIAFAIAAVFLDVNGYELTANEGEATVVMLDLAAGLIEEPMMAQWFKDFTRKQA